MPVSRNRKKRNNQNKPKNNFFNARNLNILLGLDDCKKCEGLRDEFAFNKLPSEQQIHWARSGIVNPIDYFLKCPNCDEYSAVFELEEL